MQPGKRAQESSGELGDVRSTVRKRAAQAVQANLSNDKPTTGEVAMLQNQVCLVFSFFFLFTYCVLHGRLEGSAQETGKHAGHDPGTKKKQKRKSTVSQGLEKI